MKEIILAIFVLGCVSSANAQQDSSEVKERRNIIKWNLTPIALVLSLIHI